MNELLPYEEKLQQQLNDLILPDENMAWKDMKRRLKVEDDDGIIVWWRRGCILSGLLLLALFGAGWWLLQRGDWFNKKKDAIEITATEKNDSVGFKIKKNNTVDLKSINISERKDESEITTGERFHKDSLKDKYGIDKKRIENSTSNINSKTNSDIILKKPLIRKPVTINNRGPVKTRNQVHPTGNKSVMLQPKKNNQPHEEVLKRPTTDKSDRKIVDSKLNQNSTVDLKIAERNKDSTKVNLVIVSDKTDSLGNNEKRIDTATVRKTEIKTNEPKRKKIFFSSGLGIHQQLPIAGQKLTPYNSLGRKGSFADYIPSVYFRLNKKDKWFIQSEFRYGAPQSTKVFLYQQKSVPDTGANPVYTTISSSRLKKTFYHQLPFTFNYFVLPEWSVGTGIQWNKFTSAVLEREVIKKNNVTQIDSVVSKIIQNDKKDTASVFNKNYLLGVIETQYQWKKFSVGARYVFGLQPYIKFTLPGGNLQQEKNKTVQIFIRYQLFKSKEK